MRAHLSLLWPLLLSLPAPAAPTAPPSPGDAVALAARDVVKLRPDDRPFARYLWVVEPSPAARRVWKLHQNLLSRYAEMTDVVPVAPWLWRIDLRDPAWDPATWENAGASDPFFHTRVKLTRDTVLRSVWPGGKDATGRFFKRQKYDKPRKAGERVVVGAPWLPPAELNLLRFAVFSESPVLMAEWLFAQSARQRNLLNKDDHGVGYYDFLKVKDRDDFFGLIKLNVKDSAAFGRDMQAALEKSGVSPQNRQMLRQLAVGGAAWVTLDTDRQQGRGVALRNLEPGRFRHNAEEWYGVLPNGLPVTFLSNDKGVRQNFAPADSHGFADRSSLNESNDTRIHVNLACWRCHAGQVLKDFRDDVRRQFKAGGWLLLGSTDRERDLLFRRLYFSDVYKALARDRKDFQDAITLATRLNPADPRDAGLTAQKAAAAYARAFHRYADDDVTPARAARELGVTAPVFLAALRHYARPLGLPTLADVPLSRYLADEPMPLSRLTWEDSYPLAQSILASYSAATKKGKR